MDKLQMCRICLSEDVRMYLVVNKDLRELYEKLTDIPFVTADRRPILACFFCCAKLKQCFRFMRKCLEADELFNQIMDEDYEPNPLIILDHFVSCGGFIKSPTEHMSIMGKCEIESIAMKEELDDIIEPKEENLSDLELENVDNSYLDVEDMLPDHSEPDSQGDVPVMQVKMKVEEAIEVSQKQQTAAVTNILPEPESESDSDDDVPLKVFKTEGGEALKVSKRKRTALETNIDEASGSQSTEASQIGVTDGRFTDTVLDWLDLAAHSYHIDPCLLATVQERNAMNDPACVSDLTLPQAQVLQLEDAANDQALRDIVPKDCFTFDWCNDKRTFLGRRETFTGTSGPTFKVTDQTRPIDIYDKMFNSDFIDLLVTETNRYAEQQLALLRKQNKVKPCSRFNSWSPTNRDEMAAFLAIKILQGLYPLPEESAYFTFNGFGTLTYFSRIMTINRFLLLKTFFHFGDNDSVQDTNRLSNIPPVLDYLNDRFSSLYMPSQEIAIDESLLKSHGRLSFAQKLSSKAAQVGVKTYELCESSSGYLWKFFVYTGKAQPTTTAESSAGRPDEQTDRPMTIDDDETNDGLDNDEPTDRSTGGSGDRPTDATAKIVYDLVEPLLHRGHTITMDSFYNCPLLCRSLKRQNTDCYGTLRLNREFVPESVRTLSKSNFRHGKVVATFSSDLAILVWRDANIVSMISTYHNFQYGTQDKYNKQTYRPNILVDYNKSMRGFDRIDQFLSAQPHEKVRNKVWYKKLFRRLYSAAIFNCFVIFSVVRRKIPHREFRTVLAEELMKRHRQIDLTTEVRRLNVRSNTSVPTTTNRRRIATPTPARPHVEHNHFPVPTVTKDVNCRMYHAKRTRTSWKCEECNVPLCIITCFKAYHKP